jgi:hypothetical protein
VAMLRYLSRGREENHVSLGIGYHQTRNINSDFRNVEENYTIYNGFGFLDLNGVYWYTDVLRICRFEAVNTKSLKGNLLQAGIPVCVGNVMYFSFNMHSNLYD